MIGGEAGAIAQPGKPHRFRASFTQVAAMPKVVRCIKDSAKASSIAVVYANSASGKGGRGMVLKELQAAGIKVVADLSTDAGQVDLGTRISNGLPGLPGLSLCLLSARLTHVWAADTGLDGLEPRAALLSCRDSAGPCRFAWGSLDLDVRVAPESSVIHH